MGRRAIVAIGALLTTAVVAGEIDYSGDHYHTDLDKNETRIAGNVRIQASGKTLTADEVLIHGETQQVEAKGNVKLEKDKLSVRSDSAEMDLKTGFGTFHRAILRSGNALYVEAKDMTNYATGRYSARMAKISTCQDCPQAWSVTGAYVDFEVEGFAEIHHALIQIHDTPIAYLPFYVLPVKTKRQSGFLFPQYEDTSDLGNTIQVPYYWAFSKNADATFDYLYSSNMANGGHRLGNEVRWVGSNRTSFESYQSIVKGGARPPWMSGRTDGDNVRYGLTVAERWQVNSSVTQRLSAETAGDPFYSSHYSGDFPSSYLPTLETEPSIAWQSGSFHAFLRARAEQDNLPRDQRIINDQATEGRNLHALPEMGFSLASSPILGPLRGQFDVHTLSLRRSGGPLDPDTDWIREGDRFSLVTRVAAPVNVYSIFVWHPALELRADAYRFDAPDVDPYAYRFRYLMDQTFGTTFWRTWTRPEGEIKAIKHTFEPYVRWTYSGADRLTDHPFFLQSQDTTSLSTQAPQFDIFDPYADYVTGDLGTANEELRLQKNHIFTVAAKTRLIARYGEGESKRIESLLAAEVLQDFDLLARSENQKQTDPTKHQPVLGPMKVKAEGSYSGLTLETEFAVKWSEGGKMDFVNKASYGWDRYRLGMMQKFDGAELARNEYVGASFAFRDLYGWSASAEIVKNVLLGGLPPTRINKLQSAYDQKYSLEYSGADSKCFYLTVDLGKKGSDLKFARTIKVGFLVPETGKKATFNSLLKKSQRSQ